MSSDKSDTSSDESYVSSDESDLSWDDDNSSEESLLEEEDEEEYDPRGAESDDDANECCHWSTSKKCQQIRYSSKQVFLCIVGVCQNLMKILNPTMLLLN